jgi:hypothetical protein
MKDTVLAPPAWTQDEAVAYECARECIVHLMAILTGDISQLEGESAGGTRRRELLSGERSRLAAELRQLQLKDQQSIARIRQEYGTIIRSGWRLSDSGTWEG